MLKANGYNDACIIRKRHTGDSVYIFIRVGKYDSNEEADNIINDLIETYDFKRGKVRKVYCISKLKR